MADAVSWSTELRDLALSAWPTYVVAHSNLPGPRANLALVDAAAAVADAAVIHVLLEDGGEYPTMCAAAAAGRLADQSEFEAIARALASDDRWRVREGVAMGLQLMGDTKQNVLTSMALRWADDPDPLVQRAAAAAICEPRLLRTREAAAAAIEVCRRATTHLAAVPGDGRRRPDVRTLRQALGYCWSVAVAADPSDGLRAFHGLDTSDPDVAWIVNENRRKKRLSVLL